MGNDDFDRIWEEAFKGQAWNSYSFLEPDPPVISLNLSQDEIQQCKRYALSRILNERPELKDKNIRSSRLQRDWVIRTLVLFYEEKQKELLKANDETKSIGTIRE
jgi:hypothetical protein